MYATVTFWRMPERLHLKSFDKNLLNESYTDRSPHTLGAPSITFFAYGFMYPLVSEISFIVMDSPITQQHILVIQMIKIQKILFAHFALILPDMNALQSVKFVGFLIVLRKLVRLKVVDRISMLVKA